MALSLTVFEPQRVADEDLLVPPMLAVVTVLGFPVSNAMVVGVGVLGVVVVVAAAAHRQAIQCSVANGNWHNCCYIMAVLGSGRPAILPVW